MSVFEMVLSAVCVTGVVGAWHIAVRRPEFAAALDAWAKRHGRETEKAIITAYADGYRDGREFAMDVATRKLRTNDHDPEERVSAIFRSSEGSPGAR